MTWIEAKNLLINLDKVVSINHAENDIFIHYDEDFFTIHCKHKEAFERAWFVLKQAKTAGHYPYVDLKEYEA